MKVTFRAGASAVLALLAVTLAGAAGAWACFPLPVLSVQPRASGPVGAKVTVEGVDFGEGATEVRWNALDGPLLGRGSAGRFAVPVTIPQAEDGVYAIVAFARRADDSVGVKAVTPFQVGSGASSPAAGGPSPSVGGSGSGPPPSSTSSKVSGTATAALALGGAAVLVTGGLGGAFLTRRRRGPGSERRAEPGSD